MKCNEVLLLLSAAPPSRFRGIARYAMAHGWYVSLEKRSHPPPDWKGDGVLVMLQHDNMRLAKCVRRYQRQGTPVVDLIHANTRISVPRVYGDNLLMGSIAAEHFKTRRFWHLAWYSSKWSLVHKERLQGFANAAGASVLQLVWSKEAPNGKLNDFNALRKWLSSRLVKAPKPLGVFAYSDYDASRVLNICLAAGISVPDEVAIIGVDNNELICENQPVPITSIRHDHERVGYEAAALLDRLMKGHAAPASPILIPPLGIATRRTTDVIAAADSLVRRAFITIRRDIDKSFGIEQLAAELGVSRITLSRRFHGELGCSVLHEITRQRILLAKRLLTDTDLKLEAIAAQTGFCSAAHLSNKFKSTFGVSPREFRLSKRKLQMNNYGLQKCQT